MSENEIISFVLSYAGTKLKYAECFDKNRVLMMVVHLRSWRGWLHFLAPIKSKRQVNSVKEKKTPSPALRFQCARDRKMWNAKCAICHLASDDLRRVTCRSYASITRLPQYKWIEIWVMVSSGSDQLKLRNSTSPSSLVRNKYSSGIVCARRRVYDVRRLFTKEGERDSACVWINSIKKLRKYVVL